MRHPFLRGVRFALLLCLLAPLSAGATTMRHLDTKALAIGSSDIVIGEVEAVRPHWDAAHHKIFTDVDIKVSSSLKGATAERITLTQLGGEVDGVKYSIPGGPLFRPGGEALLFVWRDTQGRPQVNGMAQGKFDIERDAATGALMVQRNVPGFAVKDVKKLSIASADLPSPRIPLDDLVSEIKAALAPEAGR